MSARPRPSGSLLAAVFWRMGATMLVAIALVSGLLYNEFTDHIDNMRDRSLSGQAADILRHLSVEPDGTVRLELPAALRAAYDRETDDAPRFAVFDEQARMLAASRDVAQPLFHDPDPAGGDWRYYQGRDAITGQPVYGAGTTAALPSGAVTVQVSQSADHHDVLADTLLDELMDEYVWVVLLVFAAILVVTYVTLRSTLRPLTEVSEQAAAIGPANLDRRLETASLPLEVRPLVEAVNNALERVEHGFREQRRFTADAAHEMRTPIAILRTHLANLPAERAGELRSDLDGLERVVAQLLKLAQVDALEVRPGQTADLRSVAQLVAEYLAPKAIKAGKSIAIEGADAAAVEGDPDALEVALRNLVENALVHSPAGAEVTIEIAAAPPSIAVLDRGPGIPEEDKAHLFDRFWRKDRAREGGAGLGLSIVSRIASAHRAGVRADDRPGGGSVFRIMFDDS